MTRIIMAGRIYWAVDGVIYTTHGAALDALKK